MRQAAKPAGSAVDRADLSTPFRTVTAYSRELGDPMPRVHDHDGIPD